MKQRLAHAEGDRRSLEVEGLTGIEKKGAPVTIGAMTKPRDVANSTEVLEAIAGACERAGLDR